MKRKAKYRVRIVDESHLVDKGGFSLTWPGIVAAIVGLFIFFTALGIGIVYFTPVKKLLPGYMQSGLRLRTEEAYLKVDSLQELYTVHQAYLDNLVKVLDTDRQPDIPDTLGEALPLLPDSLMVSSEIEREFMKKMEEAGYIITITEDYEETKE